MKLKTSRAGFDRSSRIIPKSRNYRRKETLEKKIALILTGVPNQTVTNGLISILNRYQVTPSFFLSEDVINNTPQIPRMIAKEDFQLAYRFFLTSHIMKKSRMREFQVHKNRTTGAPEANGLSKRNCTLITTILTDSLTVIKASGIDSVIFPTIFPTAADLVTEAKAAAYASKTPWGQLFLFRSERINYRLQFL